MSKKTLKRSLALGALMAFVITGSAMAADDSVLLNSESDKYTGTEILATDTGADNPLGEGANRSYGLGVVSGSHTVDNDLKVTNTLTETARNYGIVVENGAQLTLKGDTNVKVSGTGTIDVRPVRLNATSKDSNTSITFNNLTVNATSQGAVSGIDNWYGKVNVNGNSSIIVESSADGNTTASAVNLGSDSEVVFGGETTYLKATNTGDGIAQTVGQGGHVNGEKVVFNSSNSTTIEAVAKSSAIGICYVDDAIFQNGIVNVNVTNTGNDENTRDSIGIKAGNKFTVTNGVSALNVTVIGSGYINKNNFNHANGTAGIFAEEGTDVDINSQILNVNVTASDVNFNNRSDSHGIVAVKGGIVDITSNTSISVNESVGRAYGVYALDSGSDIHLADTTITATSKEGIAYGIYTDNSTADVTGDLTVTATGYNVARGVEARNGSIVTIGNAEKSNNVTINAVGTNANASGDWVIGVFSRHNDSQVDIKGDTVKINASATGTNMASSILANTTTDNGEKAVLNIEANNIILTADATADGKAAAITTMSGSETKIKGNLTATADKVIYTRGNATTIINESGNDTVVLNGDIAYAKGYTDNDNINATVKINLNNAESVFNGAIYTQSINGDRNTFVGQVTAGTTLGLSNGATWTVTDDSFVNTLNGNEGIIAVQEVDGKLANVTVTEDKASNLTVQQAGKTADSFTTEEAQKAQLNALANVVKTEQGKAVADVVAIEAGDVIGEVTAKVATDGTVSGVKEATHTGNQAIGEAAVALKAHWRAHMNDMNKRMGELRNANGEHGVWTRMVRGESEYEGVKAQYNQYQLGYDEKLSVDKRWTVGAAVTFSEGDSSFGKGSTEDDSTAFAIYGSKLNNDGTFVDLIARYARLESDITMGNATSDYSTNGMSVSAEFGKRIQQGNGLWIEPQVELTYGSVDSADYVIDGKKVQVGDMDSIIGRVGFSLGKDIKQGNVYARASYLYDFDGETETSFSKDGLSRTIEEDLGGGWWEVAVGANINLSKATYIYADVEKTFGGEVDTNWQWNLGVRYSF